MTTVSNRPATENLNVTSQDVEPLFYWVPGAGVRYYTYDYRPALRRMAARWSEESTTKKDQGAPVTQ